MTPAHSPFTVHLIHARFTSPWREKLRLRLVKLDLPAFDHTSEVEPYLIACKFTRAELAEFKNFFRNYERSRDTTVLRYGSEQHA